MKKGSLNMLVFSFSVVLSICILFVFTKSEENDKSAYEIERERQVVLNELFKTFETNGGSIEGGETPHIFINVKDESDIREVREYLSKNLPYEYVKDYEIDMFSFP